MTTEATTPKGEWKYTLVGAFLALLAVVATSSLSYHTGKEKGYEKGLTEYHKMCYNNSVAFVMIDNEAVICGRGG
jgi:hypothetical protein